METLESLARICSSRGYSSETWFRLFQDARSTTADQDEAVKLAIDSVLALVFPTKSSGKLESLGETPLSYLSLCCSKSDAARYHLLERLLERAMHSLAIEALESYEVGSRFNGISGILLSSGGPLTPSNDIDPNAVLRLMRLAFMQGLVPLIDLAGYLLAMPGAKAGSRAHDIARDDLIFVHNQLGSDKARPFTTQQIELARQGIYAIEAIALPGTLSIRGDGLLGATAEHSMPLEIELILQQCLRTPSKSYALLQGSLRARLAFLRSRQVPDETAIRSWLKDLVADLKSHVMHWSDHPKGRDEAQWKAFALAVLPRHLSNLIESHTTIGLQRQALQKALNNIDFSASKELSVRLRACIRGDLTESVFTPAQHLPEAFVASFSEITYSYEYHRSAAVLIEERITQWVNGADLPSLASFLRAVVAEGPALGDALSLQIDFGHCLSQVCQLMDSADFVPEYGAGSGMELYGSLILSLQTLCYRHSLGMSASMTANLVRGPTAPGTCRSFASLSQQHRSLVSLWITALHGNEGIDDDLLRSTGPMTFLGLAATIVEQSLQAWQMGIIDTDNLLGGLSYFTQDLLSFSLPGIIAYLARRHHNFAGSLLVIKSLLSMDSTPACVIELVALDLHTLLESAPASLPEHNTDVQALKARLGQRSSIKMDSETLSRALYGTGNLLENWQAAMRLQSISELSKICAQQEPVLASALLSVVPSKQVPALVSNIDRAGYHVETVALAMLRAGCQMPGDASFTKSVAAWIKVYASDWAA